jgi:hypothetical protein
VFSSETAAPDRSERRLGRSFVGAVSTTTQFTRRSGRCVEHARESMKVKSNIKAGVVSKRGPEP